MVEHWDFVLQKDLRSSYINSTWMYLLWSLRTSHVFNRMLGEGDRTRPRFLLLCLCDVFRALINSLFFSLSLFFSGKGRQTNKI